MGKEGKALTEVLKVRPLLGRETARLLNRLPYLLRKRIPVAIWGFLGNLIAENGQNVRSVYGPILTPAWHDSTFRIGVLGCYGFGLYDALNKNYRSDFVFIDIGANNGLYSFVAEKNPRCIEAISFEPNPHVAEVFRKNARLNHSNAELHNIAIGDSNTDMALSVKKGHSGRGNLIGLGNEEVTVTVKNHEIFDEISERIGEARLFVKIDVEGYEIVVLKEITQSKFAGKIDHLFVEVSTKWLEPGGVDEIYQIADTLGLHKHRKFGSGWQYDVLFSR